MKYNLIVYKTDHGNMNTLKFGVMLLVYESSIATHSNYRVGLLHKDSPKL